MKINSKEADRHPEENEKKEDYDTDADADYEAKRTEDWLWDKW